MKTFAEELAELNEELKVISSLKEWMGESEGGYLDEPPNDDWSESETWLWEEYSDEDSEDICLRELIWKFPRQGKRFTAWQMTWGDSTAYITEETKAKKLRDEALDDGDFPCMFFPAVEDLENCWRRSINDRDYKFSECIADFIRRFNDSFSPWVIVGHHIVFDPPRFEQLCTFTLQNNNYCYPKDHLHEKWLCCLAGKFAYGHLPTGE